MDMAQTDNVREIDAATEDEPTAVKSGWKIGLIPAVLLVGLHLLPWFGVTIPGDIQGIPLQGAVTLAATVFLALLFPLCWRQGFKEASSSVDDDAMLATSEMARELSEARYKERRRRKELDAALAKLKEQSSEHAKVLVAARRHEAMAKITIESSAEAVIITDVHGVIRSGSTAAMSLCGVHRADAVGMPFDEIFHLFDPTAERPELHPLRRIALTAVDSADAAPRLENCLLTNRLGKTRPVLLTSMAITNEDGTAIGAYIKLEADDEGGTAVAAQRVPTQIDQVTGLATKEAFIRRTEELLKSARQQSTRHHLLFIGPDNLDFTTGRHGYRAAEQMLWQVAESCRNSVDGHGQCYAVAGARLGALLPDIDAEQARSIADAVREELQQTTLTWNNESLELPVTIALLPIDAGSPSVTNLLDMAESMLRSGRRAGGNQVFTGMPTSTKTDSRFSDQGWVDWLKQRLQAGLGHLMSQEVIPSNPAEKQPQVECYVRVEDTDGVWISPKEYLPALRRVGQTALMDIWVLDQVLDQMTKNPDLVTRYDSFSINVAAESITHKAFALRVGERLARSTVPAKHICFEVLENTATSFSREVTEFVGAIQKLGAKVAIDQCRGVGLQHILQSCRPDIIKIDPALVRASVGSELAQAQVRWLAECARISEVQIVACGIENPSWAEFFKAAGIDYLQGSGMNKIGPLVI